MKGWNLFFHKILIIILFIFLERKYFAFAYKLIKLGDILIILKAR